MSVLDLRDDTLLAMYVDTAACRVHLLRGLRLAEDSRRAPWWAKLAYWRYGDGTARGFGHRGFTALCRDAEAYVVDELGWRRRGYRFACACGLVASAPHAPDDHMSGCPLREARTG